MGKLDYTVDFLNVGFGLCVVAYPTQDRFPVLVVDGGYDQPGGYTGLALPLEEHLNRLGVEEIDLMVSTHPHRDHIGGLFQVVQKLPVRRFLTGFAPPPPLPPGDWSISNMATALGFYRDMLERLHRQNSHVIMVTGPVRIQCGRVELAISAPPPAALARREEKLAQCWETPGVEAFRQLSKTLNETSLMVHLSVDGASFLLPGDQNLAAPSEWEHFPAPAQVLLIPHHGDEACLSREAVAAIGAKTGVVSASTDGTYGLPSPGLTERLTSWGMEKIFYTSGSPEKETASGVRFLPAAGGELEQRWIR